MEASMIQFVMELENKRVVAYDHQKVIGEVTFSPSPTLWIADHTEVDPSYKGQRIGNQMVQKLVEEARKEGVKILPLCPFAAAEFKKNPSYGDVLK